MKNILYAACFLILSACFQTCMPAYVVVKPVYVESNRPIRPSNKHIWVEGSWNWNRRTHAYVHRDGFWIIPNRGRTFVPGHWRTIPKGHAWVKAQWR